MTVINFPKTKNSKLRRAMDAFSTENAATALEEFVRLIDEGCDEAFAFVGAIYEFGGKGVPRNFYKARFYYEQSAERFGAVEAYLGLVRIYFYGLGVERDCSKVYEYCSMLSEDTGSMYADFFIGRLYMEGCYLEQDFVEAERRFYSAWRKGYVFALTYLGFLEQKRGNTLKGWWLRVRAAVACFNIATKNSNDPRIREMYAAG